MTPDQFLDIDEATLSKLSERDLKLLIWRQKWLNTARPNQLPPDMTDHGDGIDPSWHQWGLLAGRGFGKTRVGGEWLAFEAITDPNAYPSYVIAPTLNDVRYTCFEGESGILSHLPPEVVKDYNKTNLIITLDNGAVIRGFSAEEPERLRGPQAARAWCFVGDTRILMADGTEKPIRDVRVGEIVATRFGPRKVLASGPSDNPNPLVELVYGSTKLTCTIDHPILVSGRWKAAGEIETGDELCVVVASAGTVDCGIGTTLNPATMSAPTRASNLNGLCAFIGRFGRFTTDLFQRGITSTTKTETSPTTASRTSNCSAGASTFVCTEPGASSLSARLRKFASDFSEHGKRAELKLSRAWGAAATSLPARGDQTHARSAPILAGIDGDHLLLPKNRKSETAFSAERNTWLRNVFKNTAQSAATLTPPQSGHHLSSQETSNARIAGRTLSANGRTRSSVAANAPWSFTTLAVSSLSRIEKKEPVYDLTVEGVHEFIANGAVVHNCDELAAWSALEDTWDMMMFGLRLGPNPRVVWTTTPKPKEFIRELIKPQPHRHITRGSTYENRANLAPTLFNQLAKYEGTQLGRQELLGEIIDAEEGGIISRKWLKKWPAKRPLPAFEFIIVSLDTALTERTQDRKSHDPDPTACAVFGIFWNADTKRMEVLLLDSWEEHLGFPDLVKRAKRELEVGYGDEHEKPILKPLIGPARLATSGRKPDLLLIEDKGSGISLRQTLQQENIAAYAYNPGNADKTSRLHMVSHLFANGLVWVPESVKYPGRFTTWAEPAVAQLCAFRGPGSTKHDDHVDAWSQALRYFADRGLLTTKPKSDEERRKDVEESEPVVRRKRINPYGV